jgi:hypothetical protein
LDFYRGISKLKTNNMAQQIKITQTSNADMNIGIPKKFTAVEWLYERFLFAGYAAPSEWKEQAKQMEKEQIIKAACYDPFLGNLPVTEGEHYYDKTYGN